MSSPKLKGSLIKRLDKDEMNSVKRLHMQLSYLWLNSSVRTKSGKWTRMILKFP